MMVRLLLAFVISLIAADAYAVAPVKEPTLQLTTEIIRQQYCKNDCELDGLDLELKLRFLNTWDRPIILYKGSGIVYREMISPNLKDANAGLYEYDVHKQVLIAGGSKVNAYSLKKLFVIIPPGGIYETKTRTRIIIRREGVGNIRGSIGNGEHCLEVKVSTAFDAKIPVDKLRETWKRSGFLWTEAVYSLPMKFNVASQRKLVKCR